MVGAIGGIDDAADDDDGGGGGNDDDTVDSRCGCDGIGC